MGIKKIIIFILMFSVLCSFSLALYTDQIQAYWNMTDTLDQTGNDYNLTSVNMDFVSSALGQSCKVDNCSYTNVNTDKFDFLKGIPEVDATWGKVLIQGWVYFNDSSPPGASDEVLIFLYDNNNIVISRLQATGQVQFLAREAGGAFCTVNTPNPIGRGWHYLSYFFDDTANTLTGYVNGTKENTTACNDMRNTALSDYFLYSGAPNTGFVGMLDEWMILNSTDTDIINITYNKGSGCNYLTGGCFLVPQNITITLDYPTNTTTYYGTYNGTIAIDLDFVNNSATCTINDSRFTLQGGPTFGNETVVWQNNTDINTYNNLIFINCSDDSHTSNITINFLLDSVLEVYFYDQATNELMNGTTITADLDLGLLVTNYTTTTGILNITSLEPGNWRIIYTSSGYQINNYYFNIYDTKKTTLELYLINTTITDTIQYFILSGANHDPIDGATVTVYRNFNGSYVAVTQGKTDFVGSVFFDQLTTEEYILQIQADGFVTKTTNAYTPSTTNSPYTIFVDLETTETYFNIFDFLSYKVVPPSGILDYNNISLNFTVTSSDNSIDFFNWTCLLDGVYYGDQVDLAGGGVASDTIIINSSHIGRTITVNFTIQYDGETNNQQYIFQRYYFITGLNATTNITLSDSLQSLSDKIDTDEKQPELVKIVVLTLFISSIIYILWRSGLEGKFAAAIGFILFIPAAHYGFIAWIYAILGNLMYFFYIFVTTQDVI